jgi:hypothetical protein
VHWFEGNGNAPALSIFLHCEFSDLLFFDEDADAYPNCRAYCMVECRVVALLASSGFGRLHYNDALCLSITTDARFLGE